MEMVEFSPWGLKAAALHLAQQVEQDFFPDCVIYIARAGGPVGRPIAEMWGVPLAEARVLKHTGTLKDRVSPLLRRLPRHAKCTLRRLELQFRRGNRDIPIQLEAKGLPSFPGRILLVDDSVDTGATMAAACQMVQRHFGGCAVRTAALNVWDGSAHRVKTDYALYNNTLLMTPMSRDSDFYHRGLAAHSAGAGAQW